MGFEDIRIVFDNDNGIYHVGQTVFGKLIFDQDATETFRGIYVKVKGYCKVHWTKLKTRTVNGKTETSNEDHDSHEEYLNEKMYLAGSEKGETCIQPGYYEYPFSCVIPLQCPTSYEGKYGHIRYEVEAVAERIEQVDLVKKAEIRVISPLDLNTVTGVNKPVHLNFNVTYYYCCISSGSVSAVAKLPASGFCPGQIIPVEVTCNNTSSVDINSFIFTLIKEVKFHAQGTQKTTDVMAQMILGEVDANNSQTLSGNLTVPEVDSPNVINCRYIDIHHRIKVTMVPDGCHRSDSESQKVIIGTIPLNIPIGFSPVSQNKTVQQSIPTVDQPLLTPHPIFPKESSFNHDNKIPVPTKVSSGPTGSCSNTKTIYSDKKYHTTALSSLPSPSPKDISSDNRKSFECPYPIEEPHRSTSSPSSYKTSFDTSVCPYPTSNSQLGSKPPYSINNCPTTTSDPPYPVSNPPYPTSNSPNTTSNPPYPISNTPYPISNFLNPNSNTPQSVSKAPYLTNDYPNPTSNPPYPISDTPYPISNSRNPNSNTPQSMSKPPYLANDQSIPTFNSLYPISNAPYPSNSPQSNSSPPYPSNTPKSNPPYPISSSPYPLPVASSNLSQSSPMVPITGMRTGTLGFIVQGDSNRMPLRSSNVAPYPTGLPPDPFADATAPEPTSLDHENK